MEYLFGGPLSNEVVVERGGWWSYRDDDGVKIPFMVIKQEDEVLLW